MRKEKHVDEEASADEEVIYKIDVPANRYVMPPRVNFPAFRQTFGSLTLLIGVLYAVMTCSAWKGWRSH